MPKNLWYLLAAHLFKIVIPLYAFPLNVNSQEFPPLCQQEILDGFAQVIGKNDTYFLLTELQSTLPGDYISQIGSMGVDFELILLEREIDYLETGK